jgi:transposase-like protein
VLEEATTRGNVAKTCRHYGISRYGISRETFYQWRRRYQADGLAGLRNRSHPPHPCPRVTAPKSVDTPANNIVDICGESIPLALLLFFHPARAHCPVRQHACDRH